MGYICRNSRYGHQKDQHCIWERGSYWCCQCGSKMYTSTPHTPASSGSAGTRRSCGSASSPPNEADSFDNKLEKKLQAYIDVMGDFGSEYTAQKAEEKVVEWKRKIGDLLDDCELTTADEQMEGVRMNDDKQTTLDGGSWEETYREQGDNDSDRDSAVDMEDEENHVEEDK